MSAAARSVRQPNLPGMSGTTRSVAADMARDTGNRILIITGHLDGPRGLPSIVGTEAGLELRAMRSYTDHIRIGLFEVKDEQALGRAADLMQDAGGYRISVMSGDGSTDPAYAF